MNKKQLSGFFASLLALLAAWGIYRPSPGPSPTPSPTPVATASPEPTSEPTALPTPSPAVDVCDFPPSDGSCIFDPDGQGRFAHDVYEAQKLVGPEFFHSDGRVKDEKLYTDELARLVRTRGLCAINASSSTHTSDDETWVKRDNERSEHYDIIRSDGVPILLFSAICVPAKF